jgi:hypothetical protein
MPNLGGVASVPFRLAQLVEHCLEKRPERRTGSAEEAARELEALLPSRVQRKLSDDEGPYPGLSAFQESEADHFFGRSRDVLRVTTRLREVSLAAVIGPSGVGKSSFARAGVIPALKASGERWEAFVLRPGRQPLQSIATILQGATRRGCARSPATSARCSARARPSATNVSCSSSTSSRSSTRSSPTRRSALRSSPVSPA